MSKSTALDMKSKGKKSSKNDFDIKVDDLLPKKEKRKITKSLIIENIQLYALLAPVLIHILVFSYIPLYGIAIAFQDYLLGDSIISFSGKTNWVGFKHFVNFVNDPFFPRLIRNTVWINILGLIFGFTAPILFALLLNEITNLKFKKFAQTASYMPHFISGVIIAGLVVSFTNGSGLINNILATFDVPRQNFLLIPKMFPYLYVFTTIWQGFGWGSILYMSNISSIDPGLYESARLDGANRIQRMWFVTLPHMKNLIVIQLIFAVGGLLASGTGMILLLYNSSIYETADVIGTYVFRLGLLEGRFSYTTAIGLFASVINFILVFIANKLSTKYADFGLW